MNLRKAPPWLAVTLTLIAVVGPLLMICDVYLRLWGYGGVFDVSLENGLSPA